MNDFELALFYKPYIFMDRKEPFEINGIGYTVFRETQKSISFPKRSIIVDKGNVDFVIEYAVWYDFDIQHLYDLEHLWIYVDNQGRVVHAEGSFHGKYLNMVQPDTNRPELIEGHHIAVYSQPGKHAFLPSGNLVRLVPGWFEACNDFAGADGVLIPEMFAGRIEEMDKMQEKVKAFIKKEYSFEPSLLFEMTDCKDELFMTYQDLSNMIPDRVNTQINKIFIKDCCEYI